MLLEVTQNRNVLYGKGAVSETARILLSLNVKKLFILTFSAQATVLERISDMVRQAGVDIYVCDIVQTEPDLNVIDQLADLITDNHCGAVLALGGGSVMDAGKASSMIAANGGKAEDYQMNGKPIVNPSLPLIMIPTTAGTGSEASKVSVIYNNHNHLKKSIYSPYMIAEAVILDPEVTLDLPAGVTASTGIDALSHAIESYVSMDANPYSEMHSLKAAAMIYKSLAAAVKDGNDIDARADMLYASYFAGCALQAGIGLDHIIAQPIGGLFKIPHGDACSIFLPHSMEFNLSASMDKYCDIARVMGLASFGNSMENAQYAVDKVRELISEVNSPVSLTPYIQGKEFDIDEVVRVIRGATGHIKCNPRPVDERAIKETIIKTL